MKARSIEIFRIAALFFPLSLGAPGVSLAGLWDFTITTTAYIPNGYDALGRPLPYSFGDVQGLETVRYRYDPADLLLLECNYVVGQGYVSPQDPACLTTAPFSIPFPATAYYAAIGSLVSIHYEGLVNGGSGSAPMLTAYIDPGAGEPYMRMGGTSLDSSPLRPEQLLYPVEWSQQVTRLTYPILLGGEDGFAWPRFGTDTLESLNTSFSLTPVALLEPGTAGLLALWLACIAGTKRRGRSVLRRQELLSTTDPVGA